jgi:hypothetical protein
MTYVAYDANIMPLDVSGSYIHTIKFLFNNVDTAGLFITKNDP